MMISQENFNWKENTQWNCSCFESFVRVIYRQKIPGAFNFIPRSSSLLRGKLVASLKEHLRIRTSMVLRQKISNFVQGWAWRVSIHEPTVHRWHIPARYTLWEYWDPCPEATQVATNGISLSQWHFMCVAQHDNILLSVLDLRCCDHSTCERKPSVNSRFRLSRRVSSLQQHDWKRSLDTRNVMAYLRAGALDTAGSTGCLPFHFVETVLINIRSSGLKSQLELESRPWRLHR